MDTTRRREPDRAHDGAEPCPQGARHWRGQHAGTPTDTDGPTYGRGAGGRPLWTERDRDAERIRAFLRGARRTGTGAPHGEFVVTSEDHDGAFLVTFPHPRVAPADERANEGAGEGAGEVAACASALTRAGLSVEPRDDRTLRVRVPRTPLN